MYNSKKWTHNQWELEMVLQNIYSNYLHSFNKLYSTVTSFHLLHLNKIDNFGWLEKTEQHFNFNVSTLWTPTLRGTFLG